MSRRLKVAIATLGCKVNQYESAVMEGLLKDSAYDVVRQTEKADVFIVNTCTVTERSDIESRQLLRRAVRSGARVVATGCYAQLRPDELAEIEGLGLVLGNSAKADIVKFLKDTQGGNGQTMIRIDSPDRPLDFQRPCFSRSRAFLKIQDGCNSFCSFCAVPRARGRSRSLPPDRLLSAAEELAAEGYREIVLTGVHIGLYGQDLGDSSPLSKVIEDIVRACPETRLRLSSIEPQEFDENLIPLMRRGEVCAHVHIPLQSGSDNILRAMQRGYTTSFFEHLINRISAGYSQLAIGTDIMVGFPGESDRDFARTVKFVKKLPFTYLHVFTYSPRPDTRAANLAGQIEGHVKKDRAALLRQIHDEKKKTFIKNNLNRVLDVIVERKEDNDSLYKCISDNYLKVHVSSRSLTPRDRTKLRVISVSGGKLMAQPHL